MAKAEISWRRRTDDGVRLEIYAHHVGNRWIFYARERRTTQWQAVLDAVRRRVARRLLRPEEVGRVQKSIRERFPEVHLE
jgi:hypothetical protein